MATIDSYALEKHQRNGAWKPLRGGRIDEARTLELLSHEDTGRSEDVEYGKGSTIRVHAENSIDGQIDSLPMLQYVQRV
jgi:hypothetical protein